MLELLRLIPALQTVFQYRIEFKPDSFELLNEAQAEAFERKMGGSAKEIYRIVNIEPTVIERQGNERITVELSVVSKQQRDLLLEAVAYVHRATSAMPRGKTSFRQRLKKLQTRLPDYITGQGKKATPPPKE